MISVSRLKNSGVIKIESNSDENAGHQEMLITEHEAKRILGALSLVLDLPLTKQAQKQIDLGPEKKQGS